MGSVNRGVFFKEQSHPKHKMKCQKHIPHMPMPSRPGTMFIAIHADLALAFLKALLYRPAHGGRFNKFCKRSLFRCIRDGVFDLSIVVLSKKSTSLPKSAGSCFATQKLGEEYVALTICENRCWIRWKSTSSFAIVLISSLSRFKSAVSCGCHLQCSKSTGAHRTRRPQSYSSSHMNWYLTKGANTR